MDDELADLVLEEAKDKMGSAARHTREEFTALRTGRASPALVEKLIVDYHGAEVELQQIAGFSVPEARQLLISPYDKSSIPAVERAIQKAALGLNPANDGENIRLIFPPLTEERRRELVKLARGMAEGGKVSVRNARRTARSELEQLKKDKEISEDELARAEKQLDTITQGMEQEIDAALGSKEQELMEV